MPAGRRAHRLLRPGRAGRREPARHVLRPAAAALAGGGAGPAEQAAAGDEPEQSLDAGFRLELARLLRDGYAGNGGTVVMASHDADFALAAGAREVRLSEGTIGTATTRRDTNDQALRRMLGVDARAALIAQAALPALLAAAWLTLALTLLVATGVLHGWLWPALGLCAGADVAAAALPMARTAPINPAGQGPNLAIGTTPPWLISRMLSVVVDLIGVYPLLRAVHAGSLHGGTLITQLVLSAIVLGGYLCIAGGMPQ